MRVSKTAILAINRAPPVEADRVDFTTVELQHIAAP